MREAFAAQASEVVRGMDVGAEPEAVFKWVANHYDQGYLTDVQRNHYFKGDLSGYRKMAEAYALRHAHGD